MTAVEGVKAAKLRPQSVGVIFSETDLCRALALRRPPDLFELRLDGLNAVIEELPHAIPRLRTPLIITARGPAEGGASYLSLTRRRDLLLRFLAQAAFVDVELRSAKALLPVREEARARKVSLILSLHDLKTTPTHRALRAAARQAHSLGAKIFKIATRTDRVDQLDRLLEIVRSESVRVPVSAMGFGKLGRESRARLALAGSVLNYAHLGCATVKGQWSLAQLRAALNARR